MEVFLVRVASITRHLLPGFLLILISTTSLISQGQPNKVVKSGEQRVSGLLSNPTEGRSAELLEELIDSFYIVPNVPESTCTFEAFLIGQIRDPEGIRNTWTRYIATQSGNRQGIVSFGMENAATSFYLDDTMFLMDPVGTWEVRNGGRWKFIIDKNHLGNFFELQNIPQGRSSSIKFDLGDFARGFFNGQTCKVKWNRFNRTLTYTKPNGSQIQLTYRSPNDSQRFGTTLSQVEVHGQHGAIVCICGFMVDNAPLAFKLPQIDSLSNKIGAVSKSDNPTVGLPTDVMSIAARASARKLWNELSEFPECEPKNINQDDIGRLLYSEGLMKKAIAYGLSKIAPIIRKDDEHNDSEIVTYSEGLATSLSLSRSYIEKVIADKGVCDDPVLIWRAFEELVEPRSSYLLFSNIACEILLQDRLPYDMRLELCDSLAGLGPPSLLARTLPTELPTVFRVIFYSHWGFPVGHDEHDHCLALLLKCESGSKTEEILIDTLVQLGSLEQIPQERLMRWYRSQIVAGDFATQRNAIRVLSLHSAGQEFLFQRVEEASDIAQVRIAAIDLLKMRADATLQLSRYEFMSADLCRRVMAYSNP